MGLATTGGAEVEGERQVQICRRAVRTGGRLVGLRLRLKVKAGWLAGYYSSIFIGHAHTPSKALRGALPMDNAGDSPVTGVTA